ncbi:MAG: four helix bundle protein [Bacteroidota bacterium]|nr:four helix bundle protein [Bacteroidota bacterium]
MKIIKFEDIIAWQKAQDFAIEIYSSFRESKDWDYRNQICRATVSISKNIAEGFDRSSNADFKRFLYYSLASCSEVKSMLILANRLKYLNVKSSNTLILQSEEISKIINGLIKSLK